MEFLYMITAKKTEGPCSWYIFTGHLPHVSIFVLVYLITVSARTKHVLVSHWMRYVKCILCQTVTYSVRKGQHSTKRISIRHQVMIRYLQTFVLNLFLFV
jgi:hypothetical protein